MILFSIWTPKGRLQIGKCNLSFLVDPSVLNCEKNEIQLPVVFEKNKIFK